MRDGGGCRQPGGRKSNWKWKRPLLSILFLPLPAFILHRQQQFVAASGGDGGGGSGSGGGGVEYLLSSYLLL